MMTRYRGRGLISLAVVFAGLGSAACGGDNSATGGSGDGGGKSPDAGHADATTNVDAGADTGTASEGGGVESGGNPMPDATTGDDGSGPPDGAMAESGASGDSGGTSDASAGDGATPDGAPGDGGSASDGSSSDGSSPESGTNVDGGTTDASEAGPPPSDAGPDATSDAAGDAGTCDFNGTWASELTVNVSWMPSGVMSVILAPGTGVIKQWVLSTRVQSGTTLTDTATTLGTTYYYTVSAVNAAGTGAPSNETSATPAQAPAASSLATAAGCDV